MCRGLEIVASASRAPKVPLAEATTGLWTRDGEVDVSLDVAAFGRMAEFLVEVGVIEQAPANPYVDLGDLV